MVKKIFIKVGDVRELTMTLGNYGLIRNKVRSFRFNRSDNLQWIGKSINKRFKSSSWAEKTLLLIIEDWLK